MAKGPMPSVTLDDIMQSRAGLSPEDFNLLVSDYASRDLGIDLKAPDEELTPMQLAKKARIMGAIEGRNVPVQTQEMGGTGSILGDLLQGGASGFMNSQHGAQKLMRQGATAMGVPAPSYPDYQPTTMAGKIGKNLGSLPNMLTDPAFMAGEAVAGPMGGMALQGMADAAIGGVPDEATGQVRPAGIMDIVKAGGSGMLAGAGAMAGGKLVGGLVGMGIGMTPAGKAMQAGALSAGQIGPPMAASKALQAMTGAQKGLALGGEAAGMVGAEALMGHKPTGEGFADALTTVAGLHGAGAMAKPFKQAAKQGYNKAKETIGGRLKSQQKAEQAGHERQAANMAAKEQEAMAQAQQQADPFAVEQRPVDAEAILHQIQAIDGQLNGLDITDENARMMADDLMVQREILAQQLPPEPAAPIEQTMAEPPAPAPEAPPQRVGLDAVRQSLTDILNTPGGDPKDILKAATMLKEIEEAQVMASPSGEQQANKAFWGTINEGMDRLPPPDPRGGPVTIPGQHGEPLALPEPKAIYVEPKPGEAIQGQYSLTPNAETGRLEESPRSKAEKEPYQGATGESSVRFDAGRKRIVVKLNEDVTKEHLAEFKGLFPKTSKGKPAAKWNKDTREWEVVYTSENLKKAKAFARKLDEDVIPAFDDPLPEPVGPKAPAPEMGAQNEGASQPEPEAKSPQPAKAAHQEAKAEKAFGREAFKSELRQAEQHLAEMEGHLEDTPLVARGDLDFGGGKKRPIRGMKQLKSMSDNDLLDRADAVLGEQTGAEHGDAIRAYVDARRKVRGLKREGAKQGAERHIAEERSWMEAMGASAKEVLSEEWADKQIAKGKTELSAGLSVPHVWASVVKASHQVARGALKAGEFIKWFTKATGITKNVGKVWRWVQHLASVLNKVPLLGGYKARKPGEVKGNEQVEPGAIGQDVFEQIRTVLGMEKADHGNKVGLKNPKTGEREDKGVEATSPEMDAFWQRTAKGSARVARDLFQVLTENVKDTFVSDRELTRDGLNKDGWHNDTIEAKRQGKGAVGLAMKEAEAVVGHIMGGLSNAHQKTVMGRYLATMDMLWTSTHKGLKLPDDLTVDGLKKEAADLAQVIRANPEIAIAIQKYTLAVKLIRDDAIRAGRMKAEDAQSIYFPRHTIKDMAKSLAESYAKARPSTPEGMLQTSFRKYLMRRTGGRDFETDVVDAMARHLADYAVHNQIDKTVHRMLRLNDVATRRKPDTVLKRPWQLEANDRVRHMGSDWRILDRTVRTNKEGQKEIVYHLESIDSLGLMGGTMAQGGKRKNAVVRAEEEGGRWKVIANTVEHIPEGYDLAQDTHGVYEVKRVTEMQSRKEMKGPDGKVREVISSSRNTETTKHPRRTWIVPTEVKESVYRYNDAMTKEYGALIGFSRFVNGFFTRSTLGLTWPTLMTRGIGQNVRNLIDDSVRASMVIGKDLWNKEDIATISEDLRTFWSGGSVPWLEAAEKRGVLGSGQTGTVRTEGSDFTNMRRFKGNEDNPFKKIGQTWGERGDVNKRIQEFTSRREDVLRALIFLHNYRRLERGEPIDTGISDVRNMADPLDKIAKVARQALGDYGDRTAQSDYIRRTLSPFFSFVKSNAEWNVRYLKTFQKDFGAMTALMARAGIKTGLKASAPIMLKYGAVLAMEGLAHTYNLTMHPDEEGELPLDVRSAFHIITGRDENGEVTYWSSPLAAEEFWRQFGVPQALAHIPEAMHGDREWDELPLLMASTVLTEATKKVTQTFTPPMAKAFSMATTGHKEYPRSINVPRERRLPEAAGELGFNAYPGFTNVKGRPRAIGSEVGIGPGAGEYWRRQAQLRTNAYTGKQARADERDEDNLSEFWGGWQDKALESVLRSMRMSVGVEE